MKNRALDCGIVDFACKSNAVTGVMNAISRTGNIG